MGPSNMRRRQNKYQEHSLTRINELKKRISSVDIRTKLYKEQSNQQLSHMLRNSSLDEARAYSTSLMQEPSRADFFKQEVGTLKSVGIFEPVLVQS